MREKGLSTDAYDFTKSLMALQPGDRPGVADCFAHQWLTQSSSPIEDTSDVLTQALVDRDSQASRSWTSDSPMANKIPAQQETARLHSGLSSRLPFVSSSSHDSGIEMPLDSLHITAQKVPPQSAGQDVPSQAPGCEAHQTPNQPLDSRSSQINDLFTSCERPQSIGHNITPAHSASGAMHWRMDKELKYDSGEIKALALSPDGTLLVSGGDDKVIRIWNTKNWTHTGMLHGHTATITDLAFCPGGRWVASASKDKTVRLWDVKTLDSVARVPAQFSAKVWALAISPDGTLLATGDGDGDVGIYALPSETSNDEEEALQKSLRSVHCNDGVYSLAFSPDGQLLASAGEDSHYSAHYIKIWNPHTMSLIATLNHKSWSGLWLSGVSFSRDGKVLASAGTDSIRLWDVETGMELQRCTKFGSRAFCAHFTFDGRVAFGDAEHVTVWNAQAAEGALVKFHVRELAFFSSSTGVAKVISWPDGTLATAAHTIKIWKPVTTMK